MTRILSSLADLAPRYQAVYCDIWGVLHNGIRPFDGAVAALSAFRAAGGKVILITNAPRPSAAVIATLDAMGVPRAAWDAVVTSGDAAQDAMLSGAVGRRVWHLGPAKDDGFFSDIPPEHRDSPAIERVPLEEAEGIVCTGPFEEMTEVPEDYRPRFLLAKTRGLPLLCANPDIVVDVGDQRIYCAGALAALYEEMGGQALYFGKPHPPIYDLAARRLAALGGAEEGRILAIGDGVNTDLVGAMGEDLDALFITGGLAAEHFGPDVETPDPALLEAWLSARQVAPLYAMGRLR
ncbi:TIGR01459 family HAD-type hydrolase [Phaeovulum vinaykumarii]|uniref:HAD-superfamily class IIA hydrolase, TIGR01459 n=1 Tax=Phaeovulum vinaykumarii TaxID=407234 RepID=A0A1N7JN44_9RHOB|nr:TIGR01459 family HAD-type hydrolase [Phaeovulum vinaykumarii]SIS50730.1 HAD-superfamily class IIA hydrolase, TIGR01459 [Phaeovulum vinaykumarii]SOB90395.1 HAD superfamily hydrolase (TIGR01459 family) [Phaeovulum vinaykumarii]